MGCSPGHVTPLATDLRAHFAGWGANPRATERQRASWPGVALPHAALASDGAGCLRLLAEDGHDGAPVGSCDAGRAERFFSLTDHDFPPDRDLVRLGVFLQLGFLRTLQLAVKNRWEQFVLGGACAEGRPYAQALAGVGEAAFARLLDGFRLEIATRGGVEAIGLLLDAHGQLAGAPGLDRARLAVVVDQMILARAHCCGSTSGEMDAFQARQEKEMALLRAAGREEEEVYWLKKSCWLTVQSELEDKLLLREEVRLRNSGVAREWMGLFGDAYVELLEAQMVCRSHERRAALLREEPSLREEELEARVRASIEEEVASLEEARREALHAASLVWLHEHEAEVMSEAQLHRYRDEAKRILREIWRLTHPDTLNAAFTERQRQALRQCLEDAVEIRRSEAHLDVRALSVLREILDRVKELHAVMGVDLEPAALIQGDTLAQRTAWLEDQIVKLEAQIRELMAEIHAMSLDREVREKAASMADEGARQATLLGLRRLKGDLDARSAVLEAELRRVVDAGRPAVAHR